MNIVFTRFPLESRYGGAEVQTMSLMRGLRERSHSTAFLGSCPVLLQQCQAEGMSATELRIGPPPVSLVHAATFPFRAHRMQAKLLASARALGDIHAVCMLSVSEKILLTPHLLQRGIRVLWIEHDRVGRWLTQNPWLPRLRALAGSVTTVVVSDLSRNLYLRLGWPDNRTVAIPNGIDCTRFSPRSGDGRRGGGDVHVGTISRLSPDKGVDLLIAAVAEMPGVRLTIVGTGHEEHRLRATAKALALRENRARIRIVPWIDDIPGFLSGLDVFVLPSREHDPFGIAAAEAMATGVPTIVTDACGISRHLMPERDAVVVRANDAGGLRAALCELANNAERRSRLSAAGMHHARTSFDLQSMITRYEQLLQSA